MTSGIRCDFDILSFFAEGETGCYITPVDKPDKIMVKFASSFEMIRFMDSKEFEYKKDVSEYHKNSHRYYVWYIL